MKKIFDNLFELLWSLLQTAGLVLGAAIKISWSFLNAIWDFISEIDRISWFTGRVNKVFEMISDIWESPIVGVCREEMAGFFHAVKKLLDSSDRARAWFFVALFIVLFFWTWPPYTWGPWTLYECGKASYYGAGFYFSKTSSGERYLPFTYTAAHRKLPAGITVMVRNIENGRKVFVQINDKGPCSENRIIDLSSSAASKIGIKKDGLAEVEIYTRKTYK